MLSQIPEDILIKTCSHIPYENLTKFRAHSKINKLLSSEQYWKGRTIEIKSRQNLIVFLRDQHTRNAQKLYIHGFDVDDTDLGFITHHCKLIKSINLERLVEITDEGICELLIKHGKSLRHITFNRMYTLTNYTMEYVAIHARNIRSLSLTGCMFTVTGLRGAIKNISTIKKLNISRCHLMDCAQLPSICPILPVMKNLDMSQLDGLQPYQVMEFVKTCPQLRHINIKGCPEFTQKAIKEIENVNTRLSIENDARLTDHSFEGVRKFLLQIIAAQE